MNPLTKAATFDRKAQNRKDIVLCIECGIAFAVLFILFILKSFA